MNEHFILGVPPSTSPDFKTQNYRNVKLKGTLETIYSATPF